MRATITYTIETTSVQKATALREQMVEVLEADSDTQVIDTITTQTTETYHVLGYDTEEDEAFREDVEAASPVDAEQQVSSDSKRVVIATTAPLL